MKTGEEDWIEEHDYLVTVLAAALSAPRVCMELQEENNGRWR